MQKRNSEPKNKEFEELVIDVKSVVTKEDVKEDSQLSLLLEIEMEELV